MRQSKPNARTLAKEASHERIVSAAARAIRRSGLELDCPLAALGPETPRQAPEVRRVTTRHTKEMIDLVARQSPDWGQPGAHERALATVAAMFGKLLVARAVDEPALSDALCQASLKHLAPT